VLKFLAAAVLLFFTAAPLFNLVAGALISFGQGTTHIKITDNLGLLIKSVALYSGAAVLCVALGFAVAIWVWTAFEKRAIKIAILMLILILIPPFVHVQSWIYFMDKIIAVINSTFGLMLNFSGEFAVIITMAFSFLPLTAGLCLVALLSVPAEINDQARLETAGRKTFLAVYFPLISPALLISGLLVFLLNINDYGIPSVFGVNVFSLELFSLFSANGDRYGVFFSSLPLVAICLVVLVFLGIYMKRIHFAFSGFKAGNPFKTVGFIQTISAIGFVVFAFFTLVPLCNLIYEAAFVNDALGVLSGSADEFVYSLWTSALSAVACLIPAIIFAYLYFFSKHKVLLISLAALPFIIPAAISGLSMISLWNSPLLHNIYQSPFMPAIAMVGRFAFIEALIISFALLRLEKALVDNLRLHNPGILETFKCLAALLWKECLAGVMIVFALAMSEFGMTLLVTPPGYQTITIKIFNYLHYGASDIVAILCLAMLAIMLLISTWVFLLLKGGR